MKAKELLEHLRLVCGMLVSVSEKVEFIMRETKEEELKIELDALGGALFVLIFYTTKLIDEVRSYVVQEEAR